MDLARLRALLDLTDNVWRELDNAATKDRTDPDLDQLEELAYALRVRVRRYAADREESLMPVRQ